MVENMFFVDSEHVGMAWDAPPKKIYYFWWVGMGGACSSGGMPHPPKNIPVSPEFCKKSEKELSLTKFFLWISSIKK